MFTDNQDFYPTPEDLAHKMFAKIQTRGRNIKNVLEPSAGKGDLVKAFLEYSEGDEYEGRFYSYNKFRGCDVSCIEKDKNLQHILRGENYTLVDSDFLTYNAQDSFDLIIANPPFSEGAKHLLKAIEIMFDGQIVFLLNAETLKNPYTNERKELVRKLEELNADIEYVQGAFEQAERKTSVETAIVYIDIRNNVESFLFDGSRADADDEISLDVENKSVSHRNSITHKVAEYNNLKQKGIDFLTTYFRSSDIRGYFPIEGMDKHYSRDSLTEKFKDSVNQFIRKLRKDYWKSVLDFPEISKNLTAKKQKEFYEELDKYAKMEFTHYNIKTFAENLAASYQDTLTEAILAQFENMTRKYSWWRESDNNILHFNGWKTNDAFKVNHKVILPNMSCWDDIFGRWSVDYRIKTELDDIDKVMNYFAALPYDEDGNPKYVSINAALDSAFKENKTRNIESTFFIISVYKKGTIHLAFKDKDILRRFNVFVCKEKGWLPNYYSRKSYDDMTIEEKEMVESFEGKKEYISYGNEPLIAGQKNMLLLEGGRD